MIVFIKLVKRVSILHEKFFIYKKHFTNNTILSEYKHTNSPNIQTHQTNKLTKQINNTSEYFTIQTTSEYFQNTFRIQPNNQTTIFHHTTHQTNTIINTLTNSITY